METLLPAMAAEADCQLSGFYVAPKFLYSYQRMDDIEITPGSMLKNAVTYFEEETGSKLFSSKDDSTYGGALAIGYDFKPKYNIPIRLELEGAKRTELQSEDGVFF